MAFTLALYYPYIDIENDGWLKSAILYWDRIQTIVPESINTPYETPTTIELNDAGILIPLRVSSNMPEVEALTEDVLKYMNSPEAAELYFAKDLQRGSLIHPDKLPSSIRRKFSIHPEKLSYEVKNFIEHGNSLFRERGGWYDLDANFADFYMTLLAKRLSERVGAGLLTEVPASNKLAVAAKLDASLGDWRKVPRRLIEYNALRARRVGPQELAQGILVDLIIEKIKIDPQTSVTDILKFRENHADELGRFRSEVEALTQDASSNVPIEHLYQNIQDTYANKVLPALNDLKSGLKSSRIQWVSENALKITSLSVSPGSLLGAAGLALGLDAPIALLVASGVSLTASIVLYNLQHRQAIRENPYSFILSAEKQFGRAN